MNGEMILPALVDAETRRHHSGRRSADIVEAGRSDDDPSLHLARQRAILLRIKIVRVYLDLSIIRIETG
jgi:hypothetical protein